jgi:hypothetical protein
MKRYVWTTKICQMDESLLMDEVIWSIKFALAIDMNEWNVTNTSLG